MIRLTATTLNFATGFLTATLEVTIGDETRTTNPSFAEADLLAHAKAGGREDWNSDDVLALATEALGTPTVAEPAPETAPEADAEALAHDVALAGGEAAVEAAEKPAGEAGAADAEKTA